MAKLSIYKIKSTGNHFVGYEGYHAHNDIRCDAAKSRALYGIFPVATNFQYEYTRYGCEYVMSYNEFKEQQSGKKDEKNVSKNVNKMFEITVPGEVSTIYGKMIAVTDSNMWLMEVEGRYMPYDPSWCTLVLPHSVKVSGNGGATYHAKCPRGRVSVGDVFFMPDNTFARIADIDTKTETDRTFKPVAKVLTELWDTSASVADMI